MKIDSSKVNLPERDLESWLYQNPEAVPGTNHAEPPITQWLARQYPLPSGAADLIGVRSNGLVVVAEIKGVPINKAAILQVCRYAQDVAEIVALRDGYQHKDRSFNARVQKLIIGPSIDQQTLDEAIACEVHIVEFAIHLNLTLERRPWGSAHELRRSQQIDKIAYGKEWDIFGRHLVDRLNQPTDVARDDYDELLDAIVREQDGPHDD